MNRIKNPDIVGPALERLYSYDPETGVLRYASSRGGVHKGDIAGCLRPDGARCVAIKNRVYLSARVAWALYHGVWPEKLIDHIDGDRLNDRISNLREADPQQNQWNRKAKANTSGHKGVSWDSAKKKWTAQISHNGKGIHIGRFKEKMDAVAAYEAKALEMRGGWHRPFQTSEVI